MRAIVFDEYGPPEVLHVADVEKPEPKDDEVLIKVHATTVTAGDCELRRFDIAPLFWLPLRLVIGVRKPRIRILGQELAGEVEAVGAEVTRFEPGDRVVAATDVTMGGYAEYICLKAKGTVASIPDDVRYEDAAALPVGGMNALLFMRKAEIQRGESALIIGAGGSIGTCAVQLAKRYGAQVTAVDRGDKLDMLSQIGADHVIDYTAEDFTRNGKRYDVIFDVIGKGYPAHNVPSLAQHGRYLQANVGLGLMLRGLWTSKTSDKTVSTAVASNPPEDFRYLIELVQAGDLRVVIDRTMPLEEMVEAHRYVEAGHKQGNLIIAVTDVSGSRNLSS